MHDLKGKAALVTGGANGIGEATARRLVESGAAVVIGDIDSDRAAKVALDIRGNCSAVQFDASDADSIINLVNVARDRLGGLDILHNNVALTAAAWSSDTTVLDTDIDVWDRTMAVNLRSTFVATKAALPFLLEGSGGAIVNMSSAAANVGSHALVAYGTSKAAIIAFTRFVAVQYGAQGVRTNCIVPGTVLTSQLIENAGDSERATLSWLPSQRLGEPEDVADLVAYLASDAAGYINGAAIGIDGGRGVSGPM